MVIFSKLLKAEWTTLIGKERCHHPTAMEAGRWEGAWEDGRTEPSWLLSSGHHHRGSRHMPALVKLG
jgi:hypothetical protein